MQIRQPCVGSMKGDGSEYISMIYDVIVECSRCYNYD